MLFRTRSRSIRGLSIQIREFKPSREGRFASYSQSNRLQWSSEGVDSGTTDDVASCVMSEPINPRRPNRLPRDKQKAIRARSVSLATILFQRAALFIRAPLISSQSERGGFAFALSRFCWSSRDLHGQTINWRPAVNRYLSSRVRSRGCFAQVFLAESTPGSRRVSSWSPRSRLYKCSRFASTNPMITAEPIRSGDGSRS